jgi:GH24 family phage-related lysozyme (muramidase)
MESILRGLLEAIAAIFGGSGKVTKVETPKPAPGPVRGVSDLSLIKEFEGLRLEAYLCPAKVWTIGYGHTKTAKPGMRITEGGAEALLRHDLEWVESTINKHVKVPLTQNQYDALASFIYNVGAGAFRKSTLLRLLNQGDYDGAAGQFQRWNKAGGQVLKGLTRRRKAEAEKFRDGRL